MKALRSPAHGIQDLPDRNSQDRGWYKGMGGPVLWPDLVGPNLLPLQFTLKNVISWSQDKWVRKVV